ncbi:MAG TPA: hypothetical protein VNC22_09325 [Sporichthya sp.]|jgi:hypothetical protein|nr:hypothetical protein [Sporichthya sp.]
MRKSFYSAGAVVASVALLAVGAPTASQAQTQKELNVCWTNNATGKMDLEAVADGPSYKTMSLDSGECQQWDVRPGQYKLTVDDTEDFLSDIQAECAKYGQNHHEDGGDGDPLMYPDLTIKIKRMGQSYKAYTLAMLLNGEVTTNVKKDRRTLVSAILDCSAHAPDFGLGGGA